MWQQAKLAAAAAERPALLHGAPSSVSSGDGSGSDSSSDSGSYSSSPASSFTGSVHSIPGTPTTAQLGSEGGGDGSARLGSSSLRGKSRNSSLGRGRGQQPWPMQRSVTSRAGVLALRSSTPAREISTHLRVRREAGWSPPSVGSCPHLHATNGCLPALHAAFGAAVNLWPCRPRRFRSWLWPSSGSSSPPTAHSSWFWVRLGCSQEPVAALETSQSSGCLPACPVCTHACMHAWELLHLPCYAHLWLPAAPPAPRRGPAPL